MSHKKSFTLVLLSLNEIVGCKIIIPRIDKSLFKEIVCIDGGSTDGTIEYLRSHNIKVIIQDRKNYENILIAKQQIMIGDAYYLGMKECKTDYVVIPFTPDNNMIPEKLPELLRKTEDGDYDLVCVSRYKDGAKSFDDNIISGFGNWFFTKLVNILFDGKFTDVLGGYQCIRTDLFSKFGINEKSSKVSFSTQIAIGCCKNKLKYTDIGADEPKRIGGKSSMSVILNGSLELYTILQAFFRKDLYKIIK